MAHWNALHLLQYLGRNDEKGKAELLSRGRDTHTHHFSCSLRTSVLTKAARQSESVGAAGGKGGGSIMGVWKANFE